MGCDIFYRGRQADDRMQDTDQGSRTRDAGMIFDAILFAADPPVVFVET